jgi:hypothetical protein
MYNLLLLKSLFAQHITDVTTPISRSTSAVFHSHRFLVSGVFIPCNLYSCWARSSLFHGQFQTQTSYLYLTTVSLFSRHHAKRVHCLSFIRKATCLFVCLLNLYHCQYGKTRNTSGSGERRTERTDSEDVWHLPFF